MSASQNDFRILGFDRDDAAGKVHLRYAYASGLEFCEILDFGRPFAAGPEFGSDAFDAALEALTIVAGVSYYKAVSPHDIRLESPAATDEQLRFFRGLYLDGLGEFAYRNGVDLSDRVNFRRGPYAHRQPAAAPAHAPLTGGAAVLIGGGKDSLVSLEMMRAAKAPMTLFAVNPKAPIVDCAAASGFALVSVSRRLDPRLFDLNDAGALNGHVPITAIVSFIAIAAAFVYGFDSIILSNERSANEGTLMHQGVSINHQFSKTDAFEAEISRYSREHISSQLDYFSLLRPLSELHIARLFARTDRYDQVFTSCNRAFRLREGPAGGRWCRDCPKCRFTFLILATAMPAERVRRIFGADLLDDASQLGGFAELAGVSGHKPWECVGEIEEARAAILTLSADPAWKDRAVVRQLAPKLAGITPRLDDVWRRMLTPSPDHHLPPRFEAFLDDYVGQP